MTAIRVLAVAGACVLLWGCRTDAAPCAANPALEAGRTAWQTRHLQDYRFVWQQSCFCLPDAVQPIVVTVRHNEIVSATDRSGKPVSDDVRAGITTIDALYARAADATCHADEVRISASPDGVPQSVFIDPSRAMADEEFSVAITEFSQN